MVAEWLRRLIGTAEILEHTARERALTQQLLAQQLEITARLVRIVERQFEVGNEPGAVLRTVEDGIEVLWDPRPAEDLN